MEMTEKQKRRLFQGTFETPYSGFDTSCYWIDQVDETSMTTQHLKNDVDINEIVARFHRTGYLQSPDAEPDYLDCTDFVDYQASLDQVLEIGEYFKSLPSSVRHRFENSPSSMVQFLSDPANRDEAVKLGLLPDLKTPDVSPVKVEIVETKLTKLLPPPEVSGEGEEKE